LGMNIFGGETNNTQFSQHDKDDNVYLTVRKSF
jgi:hypothetical protein